MKIDDLRAKVEAAEKKVEKCRATIARHEATLEKKAVKLRQMGFIPECMDGAERTKVRLEGNDEAYWLLCEYEHKLDDIEGAKDKLADAERICQNWRAKLDEAINVEKVIQDDIPQVIKDFLEDWKQNVFQYYCERYDEFVDLRDSLRTQERTARLEVFWTFPEYERERELQREFYDGQDPDDNKLLNLWPRQPVEDFLKEKQLDRKSVSKRLKDFGDGVIAKMLGCKGVAERERVLDSILEEEKKNKMLHLVGRISDIIGPITDARGLFIGQGGDLNGVVLGDKGAAKVETIGAGGYNIQCFHFRMLVKDISELYRDVSGLDLVLEGAEKRTDNADVCGQSLDTDKGKDDFA